MGTQRKLSSPWLHEKQRCLQEWHLEGGGYLQNCSEAQEASHQDVVHNTVPSGREIPPLTHQLFVSAASPCASSAVRPQVD